MKSLKKELWRLRFNWCFVIVVSLVYSISTVGISSSFHQFVTNPRADELESYGNETDDTKVLSVSKLTTQSNSLRAYACS